MTRQMTATEVKAKLLSILRQVEAGAEIEITRRGVTVARLAPAKGPHALRGLMKGVATTADPNDDLYSTGLDWDLP